MYLIVIVNLQHTSLEQLSILHTLEPDVDAVYLFSLGLGG